MPLADAEFPAQGPLADLRRSLAPALSAVRPRVEATREALLPMLSAAGERVGPAAARARAAVEPHVRRGWAAVEPSVRGAWASARPLASAAYAHAEPYALSAYSRAKPYLRYGYAHAEPHLSRAASAAGACLGSAHAALESLPPLAVVLLTIAVTLAAAWVLRGLGALRRAVQDRGLKQLLAHAALGLPVVRGAVRREVLRGAAKLRAETRAKSIEGSLRALPLHPTPADIVLRTLEKRASKDVNFSEGSRVSGALYMAGLEHGRLLTDVYNAFTISNPLHADVFPSVRTMEVEVIRMVASLLGGANSVVRSGVAASKRAGGAGSRARDEPAAAGGGEGGGRRAGEAGGGDGPAAASSRPWAPWPAGPPPRGGDPGVCGALTSGGTESILSAVKASRDFMRERRGVTEPEMVFAASAHAAFVKAAQYFGVRARVAPVRPDGTVDPAEIRRRVSRNTILVVASCPGFPHGVCDDVVAIARVARERRTLLHVDCCLGGFVLPFKRALGYDVPPFDFSVPGVTSMSADLHKFGMAHKGTSCVLYRSKDLRKHQYTGVTDWTGGLYISPGFAGSRSGALIATAWASLVHLGLDGFKSVTAGLLDLAARFAAGVDEIPGLRVIGTPAMSVVAFTTAPTFDASRGRRLEPLNIYRINDALAARGWHLNALQGPPAIHICFTAAHIASDAASRLLEDLEVVLGEERELAEAAKVAGAKAAKSHEAGGSAPIYGQSAAMPDRTLIADFLAEYQHVMLDEA